MVLSLGVGEVLWPAFGVQVLPPPNAEPMGQMASLTFRTQAPLQILATLPLSCHPEQSPPGRNALWP